MSNELFSNNESDSNNQNELSGEDSLKLLVGEGKKYATVEDLAKGMVHGQNHITTLENEATSHKDAQAKQTSIDDILAAIKSNGNSEQQQSDDNQQPADQRASDSNDTVDIAQQIKEAMAEQTRTNSAVANTQLVTDSLSKVLGARANEVYTKVGKELGVDLDELAKTSPEAVIKLCTGQQPQAPQQNNLPASTQVNHPSNVNRIDGELNYKGIQDLYAKGGMSQEDKFKLEMTQAIKLGDTFYN